MKQTPCCWVEVKNVGVGVAVVKREILDAPALAAYSDAFVVVSIAMRERER